MDFINKVKNMVNTPTTTSLTEASSGNTMGSMDVRDLGSNLSIVQKQSQEDQSLVDICVSVHPPSGEGGFRGPTDICCVIDVSGSMTTSASVSQTEDAGLSVLDIVKHAVNTITQSLNSHDRLSVVTFSDNAKVIFANVQMNEAGKAQAKSTVDALRTEGRTNLWAGLLRGMDVLNSANKDNSSTGQRNTALFLLTDGVPNVNPEGGYICAMQRFKDENSGNYPGSIHTFGFGYSLKSALLHEIAMEGNGTYNFIPDSGFVGTAFVNTLANQLTSYGTQTTLSLQLASEEVTLVESSLQPNGSHLATSWGVNFNVGNLSFGQQRDFVVQVRLSESAVAAMSAADGADGGAPPLLEAIMKYTPLFVSSREGICVEQTALDSSQHGALNLDAQLFRSSLIQEFLTDGFINNGDATRREAMLVSAMQAWTAQTTAASDGSPHTTALLAYVSGLQEDLTGQIRMALSEQAHFNKWGTHYLPSLRCAHQRQQCNNFKDPGVQQYGGLLFQTIRDAAEEVFLSLPPPKPSRNNSSSYNSNTTRAPVNMSTYHNASAGCFEGSGVVSLADGTTKIIRDICPGDRVLCDTPCSKDAAPLTALVECVVRTRCSASQSAEFVQMPNSGVLLTPWHPVWHEGCWQFPMEVTCGVSEVLSADYVFNFVLGACEDSAARQSRGQSMVVDGAKCITLAHGIEKDAVASHEFYGTDRVLQALQQCEGYAAGVVVMDERQVQRSDTSGLVCGFASDGALDCLGVSE